MTDQTQKSPSSAPATTAPPLMLPSPQPASTPPEPDHEDVASPAVIKWVIIGLVALIVVIVLGLLVAIIGGISNSEGVANFFRILRDFFIIVLAMQGILICIALIILVLQVSSLINLLRTEVKPIIDETRETMSTIRGTAQFVSKNVASPIIRTSSALAGVAAVVREITHIQKLIRPKNRKELAEAKKSVNVREHKDLQKPG